MRKLRDNLGGLEEAASGAEPKRLGHGTFRKVALVGTLLAAFFAVGTERAEAQSWQQPLNQGVHTMQQILQMRERAKMTERQQEMQREQMKARTEQMRAQQEAQRKMTEQQMEARKETAKEQSQSRQGAAAERTQAQREQARQRFCEALIRDPKITSNPRLAGAVERCTDSLLGEEKPAPQGTGAEERR